MYLTLVDVYGICLLLSRTASGEHDIFGQLADRRIRLCTSKTFVPWLMITNLSADLKAW